MRSPSLLAALSKLSPRLARTTLALGLAATAGSALGAQPFAFLSAPIPLSDNQVLVLDTSDDTYRSGTRLNSFPTGYNAVAFSDRSDLVFLAATGAPQFEALLLGETVSRLVVPLTAEPLWLDALPDGSKAYVSHRLGLDVVDLAARDPLFLLNEAENSVRGVAVNREGSRAYAAVSGATSSISVIDTEVDREVARWELPLASTSLQGITVHPDGDVVYVADFGGDAILAVDAASGTTLNRVPLSGAARIPTLSPSGDRLFIGVEDGVEVLDTQTFASLGKLDSGSIPSAIDVHPDGTRVYILDIGATLSIFDAKSLELIETLPARLTEIFQSNEFITPIAP